MLAQYLVSLRAPNLQKSRTKSVIISTYKQTLLIQYFRLGLVLNTFLSFQQVSGLYFL